MSNFWGAFHSPALILFVQLTIYAIYSIVSLLSILIISVLFFDLSFNGSVILFILSYLLVMFSMFSIGMLIGGVSKDSKKASIIASLLYFSMFIFSGTTIPYEVMPKIMQNIVSFIPLTQGIKLIQAVQLNLEFNNLWVSVSILLSIFVVCSSLLIKFFKWE